MSEKAPLPQNNERGEVQHNSTELEAIRERLEAETNSRAEKAENSPQSLEYATKKVEQLAVSGRELSPSEKADNKQHPVLVNKQLKDMAYSRAMTRVRKQLSLPSRFFSKAIHSKALDRPSEIIGNTVARPSAMLGGAFFAAVGTSILLWITRHYGYEYNYLAVVLLFAIGLASGLFIEFIVKTLQKKR